MEKGESFKIRLANVAPGVFFAFFGMAVLLIGLLMGKSEIKVTEPNGKTTVIATNSPAF